MDEFLFGFKLEAAADGKSNVIAVTSIGTQEDEKFRLLAKDTAASKYKFVVEISNFTKNSLNEFVDDNKIESKICSTTIKSDEIIVPKEENTDLQINFNEDIEINDFEAVTTEVNEERKMEIESQIKSEQGMNFILNDLGNNFEMKRITLSSFVVMEITKKDNSNYKSVQLH
ncbi:hypothetical protein WA026_022978 [Henosepilachna vigintioctopunctata]|uniref:Uncharacterized protein n=1 Tax=Henosepilachna vigintioctopunctata TaxID=420089 RepID=A0AAW1TTA3_9CUCU